MSIGVAVIGYGYWGVNLARNVAAVAATDVIGVADPSADRRALAAANLPGIETWDTLEDALDDPRVDAVVLATPASTHTSMALASLEAGRDVLVEKPLAETSADAEKLLDVARDRGRMLMVGHTFLYSPTVLALGDMIDAGELGAIQYLYSQRLSLGRIRRDCNALWNFAPHDISIMLHLLDDTVTEVTAKGFSFIEPGIDDVCFASLTFASGIGANLHVSWIDPRKTRLMTVVGDEKMAIYNDVSVDQPLWVVDSGVAKDQDLGEYESMGDFQWRTRSGDIVIPRIEMSEPLRNEISAFADACETRVPPRTDGQHGLEVVRVLEAIDRSAGAAGRPVELDR
ncbi:MAG: Gfo/Idh/MocA family oxidoreductase [Acidimicrobiales bacterium]|nr:Gfo/Idh/MocA family oxidoreductase [Acidimicrobiales bacterium]